MRHLCTWLALLVGLGFVLSVPSNAAEKADPETINKLIEKLSSNRFAEREKAQKALAEIGMPALEALKKAAEDTKDMEGKRRAKELLAKLEKQVQAAKILAPKRLRLNYKDTPLSEAIADLKKKSGYEITLHDPQGKLKDRKITLDTGETTFWEAFDKFCAKAGLVEGTVQDLLQPPPGGGPGGVPFPGGGPGGGVLPGGPGGAPVPLPPVQTPPDRPIRKRPAEKPPVEKDVRGPELKQGLAVAVAEDTPARAADKKQAEEKEKIAAEEAARAKVQAAIQAKIAAQAAQAAQAPAIQPIRGGRVPIRPRPFPIQQPGQPGQIILKDGKAKDVPTSYSGAVRVQPMDDVAQMFGGAQNGEFLTGLKVSPEPKIRWQSLVALRIDKAVDDQGQKLTQAMDAPVGPGGPVPPFGGVGGGFARPAIAFPNFGGLHQYLPVRLKKGEKESKSLKEFAGSITAQVLAEPEIYITADNILKASGKTFKGKEGGSIKVNNVNENGQQLTLGLEIEQPANVVPAGQGFGGGWGGGFNGGGPIQILPALPPQALPPAKPPALPKGAFQVQVQAQPAIQVAPVQVKQIQIGGGGGGIVVGGGPAFFGNTNGVELLDEKGNVIPCVGSGMVGRGAPGGGGITFEHQMTFQLQKDQKPAKLVYKGSKSVNVEIPFTLKNVPLK
ncbi:MAG TPA: HEAT repeat domain-containing protein [Gemmataceae bacterium]|nr:HEAT repeat domain-containing protein [Gemmataceae bacterium]